MANSYFKFKEFIIYQEQAAMKVGVDSVTLGAISHYNNPKHILDIGTGTGILAFMMAQKYPGTPIDAIDIDKNAIKNIEENKTRNILGSNITSHLISVQDFIKNTSAQYDLIVCNPPYFSEDIKPGCPSRTIARHDAELNISELMKSVSLLLSQKGSLFCIYPTQSFEQFQEAVSEWKLHLNEITWIKDRKEKVGKRFVACISLQPSVRIEKELILKEGESYTETFKELTRNFYLNH